MRRSLTTNTSGYKIMVSFCTADEEYIIPSGIKLYSSTIHGLPQFHIIIYN